MKANPLWTRFLIGYLWLALMSGCATSVLETPTVTPNPTVTFAAPTAVPETGTPEPTATLAPPTDTPREKSCEDVEGNCLELTFDGEGCTYEGPTDLKPDLSRSFFSMTARHVQR
jgi:hypothetical protein